MTVAEGIYEAIKALIMLYLKHRGSNGTLDIVALAAKCNEEMTRIRNQEAADEKAARDAVQR